MTFPNDENGDILREMEQRGDDLSKPRDVDFYFAFQIDRDAQGFAEQVHLTTNLSAKASPYEERKMWQAKVTKNMVPTYHDITDLEQSLIQIADLYRGEPDGWGCFIQKAS